MRKRRSVVGHLLLATVVCACLCGCLPSGGPTEVERRMFSVKLQPTDFSLGWKQRNYQVGDIEGAVAARTWAFASGAGASSVSPGAAHEIIVYPGADIAADAYPDMIAKWFPTPTWVSPDQLHYQSTVADQFRFACIPATINGIPTSSCRAVGQYGSLVSVFVTNVFEDRWFTWEDMEHILQVIDERMAADMQQH